MALATMNLVKKNELLQQIKDNLLAKQEPKANIQEVIGTIDRNIDEAETWSLFKDAFENADRDFFKKAKNLHPELTYFSEKRRGKAVSLAEEDETRA